VHADGTTHGHAAAAVPPGQAGSVEAHDHDAHDPDAHDPDAQDPDAHDHNH
jgi:hypothetical protein